MPLSKFITKINESVSEIVAGLKVYGIAEPIARGTQTIPGVVANDGEITYPGPDDLQSVIIYHKANALATRLSTTVKGVGDSPNAIQNAYGMSMIVYMDRKKIKMSPDDFYLFISANLPYQLEVAPYNLVLIQLNSVILNSQTVYDSEYKGVEKRLPANHSLMQINYTIESTFKKECFAKCPEDC